METINWQLVSTVVFIVATVILGILSIYLSKGRDWKATEEALAQIIGDALVAAVKLAQGEMSLVTDAMLTDIANAVYGKLVLLLPAWMYTLVVNAYSQDAFAKLVIKAWHNLEQRQLTTAHANATGPH